ncbi:hypothetical protein VL15_12320 [Burkholderia cepacia]|uniref:Uncharacterized protein n=1 Tax=Burkholderia cepacia TaxID=292 RepID=A0A0J5WVF7_BURCE|nr:hypothetical protein VL15_12320 [Burkholderia cepacia]
MAAACASITGTRNRNTFVGDLFIAFLDHIGAHFRMLRAGDPITFASDRNVAIAHGWRGTYNLAAVVCLIAETDKINHGLLVDRNGFTRSAERIQPVLMCLLSSSSINISGLT